MKQNIKVPGNSKELHDKVRMPHGKLKCLTFFFERERERCIKYLKSPCSTSEHIYMALHWTGTVNMPLQCKKVFIENIYACTY